jgi:hypothetical protein
MVRIGNFDPSQVDWLEEVLNCGMMKQMSIKEQSDYVDTLF